MSNQRLNEVKAWFRVRVDETWIEVHRGIVGGLVAFSLIIVQAFVSAKIEDVAEWISIVTFAIAIPALVLFIFSYSTGDILPLRLSTFAGAFYLGGLLLDIFGLDAAFWHVSWIAGLLFLLSGLVAWCVYSTNIEDARKRHTSRQAHASRQVHARNQPPQPPTP